MLLLCVVLLASLAIVHLTPLKARAMRLVDLAARAKDAGLVARLSFAGLVAVLMAVGVPRLPFCIAGGAAFGLLEGLLWGQLGALAGSYATFLFARWAGSAFIRERRERLGRLGIIFAQDSIPGIIALRQLPLTSVAISMLLGTTGVRHGRFLIGTILGFLPQAVGWTLVGTGATQRSLAAATWCIIGAFAFSALLWLCFGLYFVRPRRSRQPRRTLL